MIYYIIFPINQLDTNQLTTKISTAINYHSRAGQTLNNLINNTLCIVIANNVETIAKLETNKTDTIRLCLNRGNNGMDAYGIGIEQIENTYQIFEELRKKSAKIDPIIIYV
jgi:hypothetical protein